MAVVACAAIAAATGVPAASAAVPSAASGSISGVVRSTATDVPASLAGVCVFAVGVTGRVASSTTGADGAYRITGLPTGTYEVEFDPTCDGSVAASPFAVQLYGGTSSPAGAKPVTLSAASPDASGIDGTLAPGSSILGSVATATSSSLAGICVDAETSSATPQTSHLAAFSTKTAADGTYAFHSLPVASYLVLFDPTCEGAVASPYAISYYQATTATGSPDTGGATDVTTLAGYATPGIDLTLSPGGSIAGTVASPGASAASSICVYAFVGSPASYENVAVTGTDGAYAVHGLPPGAYTLLFDPTCSGTRTSDFSKGWNGGATTPSGAPAVHLAAGGSVTGVDRTLRLHTRPLAVATRQLAVGSIGHAFAATAHAVGGSQPYRWSASGLQPGLSLSPTTGRISGAPHGAAPSTLRITVTDAAAQPLSVTATFQRHCVQVPRRRLVRTVRVEHGKKVVVTELRTVHVRACSLRRVR